MRVISGSARGLNLKTPSGLDTRPTAARIKESLFNIISSSFNIEDSDFIDLFAGSGAIGIEALSRGAAKAVFVDSSEKSIKVINENIKSAKFEDKAEVIKSDVFSAIKRLNRKNADFDFIFMDPPYKADVIESVLKYIYDYRLLKCNGIIICEHSSDANINVTNEFEVLRVKDYKTTKMTFVVYRRYFDE